MKQLVLLDAVEHLINAPGIPGSSLDRFFRGRGDLGDFADVVPLLCRLKAGGQDRKALLHGTGGQCRNFLRVLPVACLLYTSHKRCGRSRSKPRIRFGYLRIQCREQVVTLYFFRLLTRRLFSESSVNNRSRLTGNPSCCSKCHSLRPPSLGISFR